LLKSGGDWQDAALAALKIVMEGGDPCQAVVMEPVETGRSIVNLLYFATLVFCTYASDRYAWFNAIRIWNFVDFIQLCCSEEWSRERALQAKSSFTVAATEMARATRTASLEILDDPGHEVKGVHGPDEQLGRVNPDLPAPPTRGGSDPESRPIQTRLRAVLDPDHPHFILDGKFIPAEKVLVAYVNELIEANGRPVSFARWIEDKPEFEGATVTRVMNELPKEIQPFVERGRKGRPSRLKMELLLDTAQ
jgi:hypothetical protein